MIKNRYLLLILISLLTFIYYFEEVRGIKESLKDKNETALLTESELTSLSHLKTGAASFSLHEGRWIFSNSPKLPLSTAHLSSLMEIISKQKIIRTLSQTERENLKRAELFTSDAAQFYFEGEGFKKRFIIGEKLPHDESYYIERTHNGRIDWLIVKDESPRPTIYSHESAKNSDFFYKRLTSLALLNDHFFIVLNPFSFGEVKLVKVELTNFKFPPLEIIFSPSGAVRPAPPKGTKYNDEAFEKFSKEFLSLEAVRVITPFNKNSLKEKISTIKIYLGDGSHTIATLYQKYEGATSLYLSVNDSEMLYEFSRKIATLLFKTSADFILPSDPLIEDHNSKR